MARCQPTSFVPTSRRHMAGSPAGNGRACTQVSPRGALPSFEKPRRAALLPRAAAVALAMRSAIILLVAAAAARSSDEPAACARTNDLETLGREADRLKRVRCVPGARCALVGTCTLGGTCEGCAVGCMTGVRGHRRNRLPEEASAAGAVEPSRMATAWRRTALGGPTGGRAGLVEEERQAA